LGAPPTHRRAKPKARPRIDRISVVLLGFASLVTAIVLIVGGGGGGGRAGAAGAGRGSTSLSSNPHGTTGSAYRVVTPAITASVPSSITFPGVAARLPFPAVGQGAVGLDGIGVIGQSPNERPIPIASVTKVMTALIVLRDHPLALNQAGPVFTMKAVDHSLWIYASENDHSNVEIVAGEKIDEYQMLEALLIPSADNVADYLARWDAGTEAAFVAKMNAEAARLGLTETHYADASGVDPGSRSTAHDQVILGGYAMRNPIIRAIVKNSSVVVPTAGRVWNYNPVVGVDGIVGLKSGFTQAAQGCLVTAAYRTVGGRQVLVVSAVLGQPMGLGEAGQGDIALLDAATSELAARTVLARHTSVGTAIARWAGRSSALMLDPSAGAVTAVGWPGLVVTPSVQPVVPERSWVEHGWPAGSAVATVQVTAYGSVIASVPAVLAGRLPPPPPGWAPGHS
jgi:D-alanyl-D-alanine carboxypeptidase (penicillin-binding protein 5/6)